MKFIKIFVCFLSFTLTECNEIVKINMKRINAASHAIASIINSLSEQNLLRFQVISFGNEDRSLEILNKKIGELSKYPIMFRTINNVSEKITIDIDESQVLLSQDGLYQTVYYTVNGDIKKPYEVGDKFKSYRHSFSLIYNLNQNNISTVGEQDPRFHHLINENSDSFTLMRLNLYPLQSCKPRFEPINVFNFKNSQWANETFRRPRKKFNNCTCYLLMSGTIDLDFMKLVRVNDKLILKGYFGKILNIFAEKYEINYENIPPKGAKGFVHDIVVQTYNVGLLKINLLYYATFPLTFETNKFLVTRGSYYTYYEKMILPFDDWTWIAIIATFVSSFFAIIVIRYMKPEVQKFILGFNNADPFLNLTEIFFGLGLIRVPERNFARYLFMMFTILCLILRTAYQGKQFEFMNIDVRRPPPATTNEEIFAKNLSIINRELLDILLKG